MGFGYRLYPSYLVLVLTNRFLIIDAKVIQARKRHRQIFGFLKTKRINADAR